MAKTPRKSSLGKALPYILIIAGIIGLISAAVLTYDHNQIAANPNYVPSCNLNPIIACGTVIKSKQAEAFSGLPNPYIGLVAFPMVVTAGVTMLAGARNLKRWFWWTLEAGTIFGLGFVHWLFFETVYRIHALCPYCIAVWIVTITTFWYVTLYNFDQAIIPLRAGRARTVYGWVRRHHLDILVLWFLIIAALILKHFWYYYGKHL
jgi:uncharacterized membrane protein